MKSQSKPVKTLSKEQQNKSIRGIKKQKKNVVKSTLESPFSLDWPVLLAEHEAEILQLMRECFLGLRKPVCKFPPYVRSLKGKERREFERDFRKKFHEDLKNDPETAEKMKKVEEFQSHCIMGYNCVMRGLEKDSLAGILVKKDAKPLFIAKTFLPGCASKGVPLIPIVGLDNILKDEELLALSHSCMALALKTSVDNEECRFYPLLKKMREAVEFEMEDLEGDDDVDQVNCKDEEEELRGNGSNELQSNVGNGFSPKGLLSEEQIASYHLKRTDKYKRVFIPVTESNFLSLGTSDTPDEKPNKKMMLVNRKPIKPFNRKPIKPLKSEVVSLKPPNSVGVKEEESVAVNTLEEATSESMFVLDFSGDQETLEANELKVQGQPVPAETSEGGCDTEMEVDNEVCTSKALESIRVDKSEGNSKEALPNLCSGTNEINTLKRENGMKSNSKRKKKEIMQFPYVEAKMKRIKNNPNRKKKCRN